MHTPVLNHEQMQIIREALSHYQLYLENPDNFQVLGYPFTRLVEMRTLRNMFISDKGETYTLTQESHVQPQTVSD